MVLKIAYFYPKLLNLYGDNGNIEILVYRAKKRGMNVEVKKIGIDTRLNTEFMSKVNIVFMGGGPDSSQKQMYEDLLSNKGEYLNDYVNNDGVGLFICGAYQLFGHYYKAADGSTLDGLGIFDLHTQHFGNHKSRCIGNMLCTFNNKLVNDFAFKNNNKIGNTFVGFENHGGRTYLGKNVEPLATVSKGFGNNGEDKTEGAIYRSSIGTYSHGPVLSRNPHLADYLIAKSLGLDTLDELDDNLIKQAHTASKNLKQ